MLGGYKLIDFGGVDISTSKTISGIYNEIEKTEKRIVGCNLKLGTTTFKELTLDVKKDDTNLVLSNSIIKVTITNTNAVVGEKTINNDLTDVLSVDEDKIESDLPFIEKLEGYSFLPLSNEDWSLAPIYSGIAKNGNKLTFVVAFNMQALKDAPSGEFGVCRFFIPTEIANKLYPVVISGYEFLLNAKTSAINVNDYTSYIDTGYYIQKALSGENWYIAVAMKFNASSIVNEAKYYQRLEFTFLLSDNLVSE